jgi:hypothetical protein
MTRSVVPSTSPACWDAGQEMIDDLQKRLDLGFG